MRRVLLTGMSGTGKSALTRALRAPDNLAVDLDEPGWMVFDPALGERALDVPRILRLFAQNPRLRRTGSLPHARPEAGDEAGGL